MEKGVSDASRVGSIQWAVPRGRIVRVFPWLFVAACMVAAIIPQVWPAQLRHLAHQGWTMAAGGALAVYILADALGYRVVKREELDQLRYLDRMKREGMIGYLDPRDLPVGPAPVDH